MSLHLQPEMVGHGSRAKQVQYQKRPNQPQPSVLIPAHTIIRGGNGFSQGGSSFIGAVKVSYWPSSISKITGPGGCDPVVLPPQRERTQPSRRQICVGSWPPAQPSMTRNEAFPGTA